MDSGKTALTREERLAQQLRANLRRRKAQARALEDAAPDEIGGNDGARGLPKAPNQG